MQPAFIETLTDIEVLGLSSPCSLADGHAYQDLGSIYQPIVDGLTASWHRAKSMPIPEMECLYVDAFGATVGSDTLARYPNFKICPTASNSIDIIGAYLAATDMRAGLIEPTFDNLALLLKRRGVELVAVDDRELVAAASADCLDALLAPLELQALFLVNPNNPTGRVMSEAQLEAIVSYCVRTHTMLILDNSFRMHNRRPYDDYKLLLESGVSFIAFEDTGKAFPTLDMKASILAYSEDNKALIEEVYKEIFLCVSNFTLDVLIEFLKATAKQGLSETVWKAVDEHRVMLRAALKGTALRPDPASYASRLSVEWIDCSGSGLSDLELCELVHKSGLTLLPGRLFYWSSPHRASSRTNIRASLLKPRDAFRSALEILSASVPSLALPSSVRAAADPTRGMRGAA